MRVQITYIASSGRSYDLITNGIYHKEANYHTWEWEVEGTKLQRGLRVAEFTKEPAKYETTLLFYGPEHARRSKIQALHDDFENDIRSKKPARLYWGEYYIECYILSSVTTPNDIRVWTDNKIEIYAPYPFWIRENKQSFLPISAESTGFLDYEYDYEYDYTPPASGSQQWVLDTPFDSNFKMTIYGAVVNPHISINGYEYILYTTIASGGYAVIDSRDNTIKLVSAQGVETNGFNTRNKAASVFKHIPGGSLSISWTGDFGFDLTVYEERSEPKYLGGD